MQCRICPTTQYSCYTVFFFSDWKIQAPDGKLISDREQERGEGDEEQTGGRTGWTSLNFIKVPCSQSLYILPCIASYLCSEPIKWDIGFTIIGLKKYTQIVHMSIIYSGSLIKRLKGQKVSWIVLCTYSLYFHNVFAFVVEKLWMKECGLCQLGFLSHRIYRYIVIQLLRVTALDNRGVAPC